MPKVTLIAAYNSAHGVGVKWIKLAGATEYTIWQKYKGVWRSIKTIKRRASDGFQKRLNGIVRFGFVRCGRDVFSAIWGAPVSLLQK